MSETLAARTTMIERDAPGWVGRRGFLKAAGATGLAAGLCGCITTPTGRSAFTGLMSADREKRVGAQQHPEILREFGGEYGTKRLRSYVDNIGLTLAARSEMPNLKFTFTVLNSPIVNAFALPGGYVYISRGLLALADNEAELAGVLGHEIGHITARHTAERHSEGTLAQGAAILAGILTGSREVLQLGATVSNLFIASWSREQEFEADQLGVRYLARAGYETDGMTSFLKKLRRDSILQAKIAGLPPDSVDRFHAMATHPRTIERVGSASRSEEALPVANPRIGRREYLAAVNGILFGNDPAEGIIEGTVFKQPTLRLSFEVPDGFRLIAGKAQVKAVSNSGGLILFDGARKPPAASVRDYLLRGWAEGKPLSGVEVININGMQAATGATRVDTKRGPLDARLVAIQYSSSQVYRFVFLSPVRQSRGLATAYRRTTYSFRKLTAAQAAATKPKILRTIAVKSGDTSRRLAQRMPFDSFKLDRFLVLNGLVDNQALKTGSELKTVTN